MCCGKLHGRIIGIASAEDGAKIIIEPLLEEDVTIEQVLAVMQANAATAHQIVRRLVEALPARSTCACLSAAAHAIVTDRGTIPAETVERLRPIYGHYLDA